MQKSIILYQMFLNFFSHAPLALVMFAHAPHQCRVKTVAHLPPKSSDGAPLYLQAFGQFRAFSTH